MSAKKLYITIYLEQKEQHLKRHKNTIKQNLQFLSKLQAPLLTAAQMNNGQNTTSKGIKMQFNKKWDSIE